MFTKFYKFEIFERSLLISNKIDNFIANSLLNNLDKIKSFPNSSLFINTINYISEKLGESHPVLIQVKKIQKIATYMCRNIPNLYYYFCSDFF